MFNFNNLLAYKPSLIIEEGVYNIAEGDNIIKAIIKHIIRLISENIECFSKICFLLLIKINIIKSKAYYKKA